MHFLNQYCQEHTQKESENVKDYIIMCGHFRDLNTNLNERCLKSVETMEHSGRTWPIPLTTPPFQLAFPRYFHGISST